MFEGGRRGVEAALLHQYLTEPLQAFRGSCVGFLRGESAGADYVLAILYEQFDCPAERGSGRGGFIRFLADRRQIAKDRDRLVRAIERQLDRGGEPCGRDGILQLPCIKKQTLRVGARYRRRLGRAPALACAMRIASDSRPICE